MKYQSIKTTLGVAVLSVGLYANAVKAEESPSRNEILDTIIKRFQELTLSGTLDAGVYRGYDKKNHVGGISRSNISLAWDHKINQDLAATIKLNARFKVGDGSQEDDKSFWTAESTVGLKGAFGQVRLGRALTAMWQNDWLFDPWYNYDSIASPAWFLWHGNLAADPNFSQEGASFSRVNEGVFYNSPTFYGLNLALSYGVQKRNKDINGNEVNHDLAHDFSGSLYYENGPVAANIAVERNPMNNRDYFAAVKYKIASFTPMLAYDYEKLPDNTENDLNRSLTLSANYDWGRFFYRLGYGRQIDYRANFFGLGVGYNLDSKTNVYLSAGNKGKKFWGSDKSVSAYGIALNYSF